MAYYRRRYTSGKKRYYRKKYTKRGVISGHGAYVVNKNSLMMGGDPPQIKTIKKGEATVICHREFIGYVTSSASNSALGSAFQVNNYIIQPGLSSTFPWLSGVADNFQEYEISGMVFEYKSRYSDAVATSNTSGSLGIVAIGTNYNPISANFGTMQELLESEYSTDCKPSKDMIHAIECKRSETPVSRLYIRTGSVPAGADARLYDFCNVQIATEGCQANSAVLGEVWVSYEILLRKSIINTGIAGDSVLADKWQLTAPSGSAPLGTSQALVSGSTIGTTINGSTGTVLTFPSWVTGGEWFVQIRWIGGSAGTIVYPVLTLSGGGTATKQYWANSSGFDQSTVVTSPAASVSSVVAVLGFIINIPDGATLPVTASFGTSGTLPSSSPLADLIIMQCPSGWSS